MNSLFFSYLFVTIVTSITGLFLFIKARGRKPVMMWAWLCTALCVYGLGGMRLSSAQTEVSAIVGGQIFNLGLIFIPVTFFHFVDVYCGLKQRLVLRIAYAAASAFALMTLFAAGMLFNVSLAAGSWYAVDWETGRSLLFLLEILIFYFFLFTYAAVSLIKTFLGSQGLKRIEIKYLIFSAGVGFIGCYGNLFGVFDPAAGAYLYANYAIALFPLLTAYAIIRYRGIDVSVIMTRTGILAVVYSLVLGVPFAMAFGWRAHLTVLFADQWWVAPLITSTLLATAGPFAYLYFQKRTEERIFQEQRYYQASLRHAAIGMGRIKDLNRLLSLIVHIVTRTVKIEHSQIFLRSRNKEKYRLCAFRSQQVRFHPQEILAGDSEIVQQLRRDPVPIVYDEIRHATRVRDRGERRLARLEAEMKDLEAALIVPSLVDDHLIAVLVLGRKLSGKIYTEDDLAMFSILAGQAALAIENAQFYEEMRHTNEQLFKAEKMATIGIMADGLSHQINNRLHALGFIASDVLDTIRLKKTSEMSDDLREMMVDIEHALSRVQDNVNQGGEIVRGLLKYSRQGESGYSEVSLDSLVEAAMEMAQFKIKKGELILQRDFPADTPSIRGNFTQLQEVFFNVIDNAYDAMQEKRSELKDPEYRPLIRIDASRNGTDFLDIVIEDNGMGIKENDNEKLFTPFFTTKLSSRKGTGLGLFVIRRLIEENHGGKVSYESLYKKGTKVLISLPIYK